MVLFNFEAFGLRVSNMCRSRGFQLDGLRGLNRRAFKLAVFQDQRLQAIGFEFFQCLGEIQTCGTAVSGCRVVGFSDMESSNLAFGLGGLISGLASRVLVCFNVQDSSLHCFRLRALYGEVLRL